MVCCDVSCSIELALFIMDRLLLGVGLKMVGVVCVLCGG